LSSRLRNDGPLEETDTLPNARRPERETSVVPPRAGSKPPPDDRERIEINVLPEVTPLFESNTGRGVVIGRASRPGDRSSGPPGERRSSVPGERRSSAPPRKSSPPARASALRQPHVPLLIAILIVTAIVGALIPWVIDIVSAGPAPAGASSGSSSGRVSPPMPWTSVIDYFFGK
jgi:hypothetical protein